MKNAKCNFQRQSKTLKRINITYYKLYYQKYGNFCILTEQYQMVLKLLMRSY